MGKGKKKNKAKEGRKGKKNDRIYEVGEQVSSKDESSLYMCTSEYRDGPHCSYTVYSIKLSDLLSERRRGELRFVASMNGDRQAGCGVFGSQIIFAGGVRPIGNHFQYNRLVADMDRDLYALEAKDGNPKMNKLDHNFLQGKPIPILEEVGGKLYALARVMSPMFCGWAPPRRPSFEVLGSVDGEWRWSELPEPPFLDPESEHYAGHLAFFSHVIVGTTILVHNYNDFSHVDDDERGSEFVKLRTPHIFTFDVAAADKQWVVHKPDSSSSPFPFSGRALIVDDEEEDGGCSLMFTYNGLEDPDFSVAVYFLSPGYSVESIMSCGSTKAVVKLPKELSDQFGPEGVFHYTHSFVHVGCRQVCLVLTSYMPQEFWDSRLPCFKPRQYSMRVVT